MSIMANSGKSQSGQDAVREVIQLLAVGLAKNGYRIIDAKPKSVLVQTANGQHLMIGAQECE